MRKTIEAKESGIFRHQLVADFSATKRTAQNWAVPENRHSQFWGDYAPPGCAKIYWTKMSEISKRWGSGEKLAFSQF
nr:MAG TPA: hypothetical protein [Caudoviricetes sp.]